MRSWALGCLIATLCNAALPQNQRSVPMPQQFEIGRHPYFDFGPPFDFYELFIIRPMGGGSSLERITITPAGDKCFAPEEVETQGATTTDSVASLLGPTNPCAIPEKDLRRELKRRKKHLVFSGADVVMQVRCGTQTRLIRSDILDRDMFDPAPRTPEHTAWTMRLLSRLDQLIGPGVIDKPLFAISENRVADAFPDSPNLLDLGKGKYDALFQGAPNRPSDLYDVAKVPRPPPIVRLLRSSPAEPEVPTMPEYPKLARMTHVEGQVEFTVDVDLRGKATNVTIERGHAFLREAVKEAASSWRFPREVPGLQIHATLEFGLNCPMSDKAAIP
jgi:TonB family protein